ncbi:hypothetical protein [Prosthecodimorpha hirschii]|uniref:hypothetical protein n=1 Tax=Prosthecodimorpha hirschii TaxID=665126 RepID=UPI001FEFF8ED|nr:hypothetical protein [Prosthecomicrobium hirschii]
MKTMEGRFSTETGARLVFETRPITFTHSGHSVTVDMPGWYGTSDEDAVFGLEGQAVYQRAMTTLKARAPGL